MTITCITCHQPTYPLQPVRADIIQQPDSGEWGIDLILACQHSRPRHHPAATFHQTHEGNKCTSFAVSKKEV